MGVGAKKWLVYIYLKDILYDIVAIIREKSVGGIMAVARYYFNLENI